MRDVIRLNDDEFAAILEKVQGRSPDLPYGDVCLPTFDLIFTKDNMTETVTFIFEDDILKIKVENLAKLSVGFKKDGDGCEYIPLEVECSDDDINRQMQSEDDNGLPTWVRFVMAFWTIQAFLRNYNTNELFTVEEKVVQKSRKKGKKAGKSKVRMYRCYTLKKGWKSEMRKRRHTITCESWGVRGHYRHYKSGKVVFINAYTKGNNRSQYKAKEYALLPKRR